MHRHSIQHHIYHSQHPQCVQQSQQLHDSQLSPFDSTTRHCLQQVQEASRDDGASQDQWPKKRSMCVDDDELLFKKRSRGEASPQRSSWWYGLLESAASSPGSGTPHSSNPSDRGYFDRHSSPHYDPATPPLEPGPFQANAPLSHFQPTDAHLQYTNARLMQEVGRESMSINSPITGDLNSDMGMEAIFRESIRSQGGISIRSLSPAPSSPGGSIKEVERSQTPVGQDFNYGVVRTGLDHEAHHDKANPPTIDKRVHAGRLNLVMGFRPGCERCLRHEKGHFAHFE